MHINYTKQNDGFTYTKWSFAKIVKALIYVLHNSSISYQTEIGDNCKFLYGGIGCNWKRYKIGNHVIIGTNVLTGGSNKPGMPTIGNNVYRYWRKILGNITIGDNVIVGANAVVINDVEPNCSVGGVPARVLKRY